MDIPHAFPPRTIPPLTAPAIRYAIRKIVSFWDAAVRIGAKFIKENAAAFCRVGGGRGVGCVAMTLLILPFCLNASREKVSEDFGVVPPEPNFRSDIRDELM